MKSRLPVLPFVAATICLMSGSSLQAGSTELWNTQGITTISHNSAARIKGSHIVWQSRGGLEGAVSGPGDYEILLYDIENQLVVQLTDDDYDDISPQTDGKHVVWQKHDTRCGNHIFLYDIHGENPPSGAMISSDDSDSYSPRIAAGRVVWTSREVTGSMEPGEIFLRDIAAGITEQLTDNNLEDGSPRINDDMVIWVQADDTGRTYVLIHYIGHGTEPAPEGFVWTGCLHAGRDLMALARHDGHDNEIFVHGKTSGKYHQITDNELDDRSPCMSENRIVWVANGEIFLAEFKYLALTDPVQDATLSPRVPATFTWEGIGYEAFKVQFSKDPGFPATKTLTLPLKWESELFETSYRPPTRIWRMMKMMRSQSGIVYWRVEGTDEHGAAQLSEARGFTLGNSSDVPRRRDRRW